MMTGLCSLAFALVLTGGLGRSQDPGTSDPGAIPPLEDVLGRLPSADISTQEPQLRRLLEGQLRIDPDNPNAIQLRWQLGTVLWTLGKYAEAEAMLRTGLEASERILGETDTTGLYLNTLGSLLTDTAQITRDPLTRAEAAEILRRAVAILEDGRNFSYHRTAMHNLARALSELGDHEGAVELLREVLPEEADSRSTAASWNNLGSSLTHLGRFEEAEEVLNRAKGLAERYAGKDSQEYGIALNNLAFVYESRGEAQRAVAAYTEAVGVWTAALGPRNPMASVAERNLFYLLSNLGDVEAAWPHAVRSVEYGLLSFHSELLQSSQEQRFELARALSQNLNLLISCGLRLGPEERAKAYELYTGWKGMVFRATVGQGGRPLDADGEKTLEQVRLARQHLARLAHGDTQTEDMIRVLRASMNEAEGKLAAQLWGDGVSARTTAGQLSDLLPSDSAFVDLSAYRPYTFGSPDEVRTDIRFEDYRVLAWIVLPGEEELRLVDLGPAEQIQQRIGAYHSAIAGTQRGLATPLRSAGVALREMTWDPLRTVLEDSHRIFVAPDQFLGAVPLGALPENDQSYLIETHAFAYVEDAVTLAQLLEDPAPQERPPPTALLVGGVDYGPSDSERSPAAGGLRGRMERDWVPLPGTAEEIRALGELHKRVFGDRGGALQLSGTDATETRVSREMPRHSVVHLATHGFFVRGGLGVGELGIASADLLTGVVLAGANEPEANENDGYLTGSELFGLRLDCDLVVLSACETSLGAYRGGEGMLSLRRAFREAGARAVMSSLWKVSDEPTQELMGNYYRRYWEEGLGALEALRGAQLDMLRENKQRTRGDALPETWGAFALSGDWR